jgi:Lon protease-like protein
MTRQSDFPLFDLGLVALPTELVPLYIFEDRYKAMMGRCLEDESEFGIVWTAGDEPRAIGCACEILDVLERYDDGRLNLVARGTRPFRVDSRQEDLEYPAGTIEFLADREEDVDPELLAETQHAYSVLVEEATDHPPTDDDLAHMGAYAMAATVEFGLEAKQGLLDLRSETARLRLLGRLLRAAVKRIEFMANVSERARSNGKVRFGPDSPDVG